MKTEGALMERIITGMALFLLFSMIFAGFLIGKYIFPQPKVTPVSDRLKSCEAKGGEYGIYYNGYSEKYVEQCNVSKEEITDF